MILPRTDIQHGRQTRSVQENRLGEENTKFLQDVLASASKEKLFFIGRPIGLANCILVAQRDIAEWEWTRYMTDLLNCGKDIRQFLHASLIQGQEKETMNVIGNSLSQYPDIYGLVILKV